MGTLLRGPGVRGGVTEWKFCITVLGSRTHLGWGGGEVGAEKERDESRGEFWEVGKEQGRQDQLKNAGESDIPGRGATPSPLGGVLPVGAVSPGSRMPGSLPRVLAASMPLTLRAWRLPL